MIAQQSTYNGICDPNKWLQSSMGGGHKKNQNIKINNCDGETAPLYWKKTMMIYDNNMIVQKSTSDTIGDPNKWSLSSARKKQRKTTKNNNKPLKQ